LRGENTFREVFEIHLVHDADPGRDELESIERLLPPFQELIALPVAFELHVLIKFQRARRAEKIHLDGVIDHQINGNERLYHPWVPSKSLYRASHRR
jgi:hypothetical protein